MSEVLLQAEKVGIRFGGLRALTDFSLTVVPASQQICPGWSAVFQAQIGSLFGFTHPVTLDVSGEPAGETHHGRHAGLPRAAEP